MPYRYLRISLGIWTAATDGYPYIQTVDFHPKSPTIVFLDYLITLNPLSLQSRPYPIGKMAPRHAVAILQVALCFGWELASLNF